MGQIHAAKSHRRATSDRYLLDLVVKDRIPQIPEIIANGGAPPAQLAHDVAQTPPPAAKLRRQSYGPAVPIRQGQKDLRQGNKAGPNPTKL